MRSPASGGHSTAKTGKCRSLGISTCPIGRCTKGPTARGASTRASWPTCSRSSRRARRNCTRSRKSYGARFGERLLPRPLDPDLADDVDADCEAEPDGPRGGRSFSPPRLIDEEDAQHEAKPEGCHGAGEKGEHVPGHVPASSVGTARHSWRMSTTVTRSSAMPSTI